MAVANSKPEAALAGIRAVFRAAGAATGLGFANEAGG